MPADDFGHRSMGALMRLLRLFSTRRQRRAARRRTDLHGFMAMSDRELADIGMRRAHVYGALVGAMPLGRHATTATAPEATICRLRGRPTLRVVADDLNAAA
jgi:uncharacterized protein YjiS (DUF1127 family)